MSYSDAIAERAETLSKSLLINGVAPLAGRVLLAAIFLLSGISKISDPAGTIGYINMVGLPFPSLSYGAAVVTEIVGGGALILGFQTRIVALVLALFSIVTAVTFHNNLSDLNQFIHFFKNIAMAGGLLQVVAFGAGRLSLDARR
ncbi:MULTISPECIES: DoxX family protein [Ensifer]|uniref:DoxX family protein n=1 Tax=Ensifer adhaerens TaxID=106592 RepID=A0ABY8HSH5_ENSAD|nr:MULTISPECIES: DoxX family protein [Ensifer]ANK76652.1 LysR family transcriptional regulator [Ensifer adhaerens]KDP72634.1 LysR family transcriptional regulator [Ensifer adhaerens]KQX24912.1 LysR family transcriptional regulator [Ensifer sp. Root423]KQZ58764.1 LysR family transcriptional regulator [Ensifer sp. Root558]WFP95074.1 DoxX family protein [Ensifer adhaerens]